MRGDAEIIEVLEVKLGLFTGRCLCRRRMRLRQRRWRGIDVYPAETRGWLVTRFRDCHPITPSRTVFDLDADPPAYAADFMDIKG
jgi:hypothetical protein